MGCPGIMAWNVSLELGTEVGIRLLLFIVFVWTDLLEPFRRKIQPEEMWLYKNPTSKEDRVPTLHMFAIAYIVPVFTVLFIYFIRYGKPDLKPAFLAMSLGMVINGVLTNCIKLMVGRPRPDFYYRCFPDGLSNSEMDCSGLPTEVSEGLKSFPSGHSSHVFAGLGFLALYLAGKLRCFVPAMRAPGLRLIIVILPLFIAALIAISRTCDYKHHWQDVVVGSLLGFGCAFLAYRQYYPSLSGTCAGSPVHSVKLRHTSEVESTEGHFV